MQNLIAKVMFATIVGGFMCFGSLSATDRGFFIGGEVGYSAVFETTTPSNKSELSFPFGNLGVKIGYTFPLGDKFGMRAYFAYNWAYNTRITSAQSGGGDSSNTLFSLRQMAGNVDILWSFTDILGAYIGVGAGYASYNNTSTTDNVTTTTNVASGFVLPVNVGLEAHFGTNHNISLNFKIPTLSYKRQIQADATTTEVRNLIITLGYAYRF